MTRARLPDSSGVVDRDGVRIAWEACGQGDPTLLLMPTWSIIPSRSWKAQVPYLARHFRVITFDGRGSGASDRPVGVAAYADGEFVSDAVAVLDSTGTDSAVVVGFSAGVPWGVQLALDHPARVRGIVAIGPSVNLVPGHAERGRHLFEAAYAGEQGWGTYNRDFWLHGDYDAFLRFFFGQVFSEPHSTKQVEDCVAWGHAIGPERLVETTEARQLCLAPDFGERLLRAGQPVLVVHGADDRVRPHGDGAALAQATRGTLVTVAGGGHAPHVREPVLVNLLVRDFAKRIAPRPASTTVAHGTDHRPRALYLSSPIGLGHARRDLAIAHELRRHHPGLQIDWLTQHPVTTFLERHGERVHPASSHLASESAHIEDEAADHDLHVFQAIRRMDEILVSNYMVFDDLVSEEPYDLVIGDEAWDVDYFLHENPTRKRFSFAWLTDFVGWLPMPDGGAAEAALTADYNAEMIEQRARFRRLRDRSIFVGNPDDVVPTAFGPGLPGIREWTEGNFDFSGYVTGFDPLSEEGRVRLRAELGYTPDDRLCVVTVGGSGVGAALIHRVLDAVPTARRALPDLKVLVVCGPRIDPRSLPRRRGVRIRGFVPDLHRLLGAADVALVQGGLTTCMELTAQQVPFVYVPLRHHFEQNLHVRHRLEQYGAGRCLTYEEAADPDALTAALAEELGRTVAWRPVETGGAARAAALLADLL